MKLKFALCLIALGYVVVLAAGPAGLFAATAPVNSRDLSVEVRKRLEARLPAATDTIRVEANRGGRIELTGFVGSLRIRQMASETAESVRGVQEVVNKLRVAAASRTDEEISGDVEQALEADPATSALEINVSADDGVVTLRGTVETVPQKRIAAWVASGLLGVSEVINQIRVVPQVRDDGEILRELLDHYMTSSVFNDDNIGLQVNAGVVELSGTVDTALEKTWARADAWVPGVRQVNVDQLRVHSTPSLSQAGRATPLKDEKIRQIILKAFAFDPRVASVNPEVIVEDHVVTLRGDVSSRRAKQAAVQIAQNTGGVSEVIDQLNVKLDRPRTDTELANAIRTSLRSSAALADDEVKLAVNDGRVALQGVVDSAYEKWVASDLADRTAGVMQVDNQLVVNGASDTGSSYAYFSPDSTASAWIYAKGPPRDAVSDADLVAAVERELAWSPFADGDDIQVSASGGAVTLVGDVDSVAERRAAIDNAYQAGARDVVNELHVTGVPRP